MMVFWVVLALMTGAAVMTVLWPLSRAVAGPSRDAGDVMFYREQLAEIARDERRGLFSAPEAAAARIESGRRLIRAAEAAPQAGLSMGEPALRRRRAASAVALSVVPLVGLALYGVLGSPHLAGRSPIARQGTEPAAMDVASALQRIEAHLAQSPDDRRGWALVAPIYLRLGRYDDAARAFNQSIRLGDAGEDQLAGYGESLVSAGGGVVSADARAAFERALAVAPASAKARFYLALAAEQDGDLARARAGYNAIIASAAPDAVYLPVVRARLAALDGASDAAATPSAPNSVPPEIVAMVEGLDGRLMQGGGSEAEWTRLIRSMTVLGRDADARDRLARAKAAFAGDPAALGRLEASAALRPETAPGGTAP
jgi:cytochrome c-type biogenesis protein CcmH